MENIIKTGDTQTANVNEFLSVFICTAMITYAMMPMLENSMKGALGFAKAFEEFKAFRKGLKDKAKGKDDDSVATNVLLSQAKKANENDSNEEAKKRNGAMIDMLLASSYDKDGNEIPMDKRAENLEKLVGKEQFEQFTNQVKETCGNDDINSDAFKDQLKKMKNDIDASTYDEIVKNNQAIAQQTQQKIEETEKDKEELKKLEEEIEKETDPDKKKELEKKIDALKTKISSSPLTLSTAPRSAEDIDKEFDAKEEALDKEFAEKVENAGSDEEKEALKKEWNDKAKALKEERKATHEANKPKDPDPKQDPKDIEKELEKIEAEYKEKSKALEKEYEEKIEKESDADKKKALEDEWEKKERELSAERNKKKDAIDDNDDHTDDDETKGGKYKVKEEEVDDPNNPGKKIKVKTYTGPRGGKFYYPDGKPKKPENKVYVESMNSGVERVKMLPLNVFLTRYMG